jgi:hypothetical protein
MSFFSWGWGFGCGLFWLLPSSADKNIRWVNVKMSEKFVWGEQKTRSNAHKQWC